MVGMVVPSHLCESSDRANITAENGRNVDRHGRGFRQALGNLTQELGQGCQSSTLWERGGHTVVRITDHCTLGRLPNIAPLSHSGPKHHQEGTQ